jgi:RNA-directed DNA polymerase
MDTLNPIITGWPNYHQGVVSKSIFSKIDSRIWNMLWKWVFASGNIQLKYISNTRIIRTIPIKLDKNPYLDKDYWFDYKTKERNRIKKQTPWVQTRLPFFFSFKAA